MGENQLVPQLWISSPGITSKSRLVIVSGARTVGALDRIGAIGIDQCVDGGD